MNRRGGKFMRGIVGLLVLATSACFPRVEVQRSRFEAGTWKELKRALLSSKLTINDFGALGPFSYEIYENYRISVRPKNPIPADLFVPDTTAKTPLVVMVHGNKFNKDVHENQCHRFTSWGFHCVTLEVPNRKQWLRNGWVISRLVELVHRFPESLSNKIDTSKIILVGHSFGGSAVTIAAGRGAPIAGLILLDPAVVHRKVRKAMKKVRVPVVLIGADPMRFSSRKRSQFFKNISGPMSEVTVVGSTHNDAQYPSIDSVRWGFDLDTSVKHQEVFLQSMIAAAFSISLTSGVDMAWQSYLPALQKGQLKDGKIRPSSERQLSGGSHVPVDKLP